jgi:hypothetical protein
MEIRWNSQRRPPGTAPTNAFSRLQGRDVGAALLREPGTLPET